MTSGEQVPGPGARSWGAKIMRRPLFHGSGGHSPKAKSSGRIPVGANRRVAPRAAASCGSRAERLGKGLTRPMLFAPQALAPGPRPKHPGNVQLFEPRGRAGGFTQRNLFFFPILSRNSIFPNPLLIDDMGDFPPSLLQAAADEPAMAAPGKALGAKDGGAAAGRHSF